MNPMLLTTIVANYLAPMLRYCKELLSYALARFAATGHGRSREGSEL
jgi:hypothetical protein